MDKTKFKKIYDPKYDRYVKRHIYTNEIHGEGLMDIFRSVGSKLFSRKAKDIAKKTASTAANKAASISAAKVGEHIGNKAGDKIVQLLSKKQPPVQHTMSNKQPPKQPPVQHTINQPLTDFEIAQRVNQLISGGKMMKKVKFM